MAWTIDSKSKHRRRAGLVAGIMLTATLALGSFSGSAGADERRGERRDERHGGERGYYRAPPVVYGSPYYAAPPVVYGSPFGLNINIR
jgi:hypothetical protein